MVRIEVIAGVALINFLAGFVGIILILWGKKWNERNLHWGIGFGAGLLIGISLLEIVPTAIDLAKENAMAFVLLGFVGFFLIEKFILVHHFDRFEGEHPYPFTTSTFIVLCLHAFMDGIVIGLGLRVDEVFGLIIFVAIFFHKLPLAVSLAGLIIGRMRKKDAVVQILVFALATPVGLVLSVLFLGQLREDIIGVLVALNAGIFLYLGATDMLPEIMHSRRARERMQGDEQWFLNRWIAWEPTLWVLIGMTVSFLPKLLHLDAFH